MQGTLLHFFCLIQADRTGSGKPGLCSLVETLVGFAGVPGKRSATTIPALVLGPEINPKRILDLLPFQNNLFHVQFLTIIKDRSPPQAKQKHQHHLLEALPFPLAFEAAHKPPGIMVPQGPAGPSILKMVFCQFHDFGEIIRIHFGT